MAAGRTHVSRALRRRNNISEHASSRGLRIVPKGAIDLRWPNTPCFSAYKMCLKNVFFLSCSRPQPSPRQATSCSPTLSLSPSSRKPRDSKAFLSQPPILRSWPTNRPFGSLYERHSSTTRMRSSQALPHVKLKHSLSFSSTFLNRCVRSANQYPLLQP